MTWIYLDDNFPDHPKVMAAMSIQPLAPWLFVCGLGHCRKHLTGGVIGPLVVPTLMPLFRPKMRQALIQVALWEDKGDGWIQVHDYDFWNHTEDEQRQKRSDKARKGATAMWEKRRQAEINARADA